MQLLYLKVGVSMFKKNKTHIVLLALILLLLAPLSAYGEEATPVLTGVVVEIEGKGIVVNMLDYSIAYALGEGYPLYDYLNSDGAIKIIAYQSNDKYMDSLDYAIAYALHGESGAVEKTESLSMDDIRDYLVFLGFEEGQAKLAPLF